MNPDTVMALKVGLPALLVLVAPFLPWVASRWGRRREWVRTADELGAEVGGGYRELTMRWSGDAGVAMSATATDGQPLTARVTGPLPPDISFAARGRSSVIYDPVGDPVFAQQVVVGGESARLLEVLDEPTRMIVASAAAMGWRLDDGELVLHARGVAHKYAGTRAALTVGSGLGALLVATHGAPSGDRLQERASDDPLPSVRVRAMLALGEASRTPLIDALSLAGLDQDSAQLVTMRLMEMVADGRLDRTELLAVGESLLQSDELASRQRGASLLGRLGQAVPAGGLALVEAGSAEGELALAVEPEGRLSPID